MRRQQMHRKQTFTSREGTASNNWVLIPDPQRAVWDMTDEQVANGVGLEVIPKSDALPKGKGTKRKRQAKVEHEDDSSEASDDGRQPSK